MFIDAGHLNERRPEVPRFRNTGPKLQVPTRDPVSATNERPGLEALIFIACSVAVCSGLAEFDEPTNRGSPALGVAVGVGVRMIAVERGVGVGVGVAVLIGGGAGVFVLRGVDVAVG